MLCISAELRAVGYEPSDLIEEMEEYGYSGGSRGGYGGGAVEGAGAEWAAETEAAPAVEDPLSYKETVYVPPEARHLFGPTPLAAQHKDGGTGG